MLMLDIAVINSALPRVSVDLHASLSGVTWIIDAYTLALAATVLTAGSLADRYGRRRVFVAGLVLFTISSVVCALSTSIVELDTARAVQGIGGAAMFSTSLALLATAYPDWAVRAKALAVYGATIGASFAVGPLVGGAMTSWFGWRSVFWLNVPIGILCVLGAGASPSRVTRTRAVPTGSVSCCRPAALFLLVLALLRGNEAGWSSRSTVLEFAGAAVLLAAFLAVESRIAEPMLPLKLFTDRSFTGIQLAAVGISSSLFAIFVYLTFYFQGVTHLSPIESGLAYLPGTVLSFVVAGASASFVTKIDSRVLLTARPGPGRRRDGARAAGDRGLVVDGPAAFRARRDVRLRHRQSGAQRSRAQHQPAKVRRALPSACTTPLATPASRSALRCWVRSFPSGALGTANGAATYVNGLHRACWVATAVAVLGAIAAWRLVRPQQPGRAGHRPVDDCRSRS